MKYNSFVDFIPLFYLVLERMIENEKKECMEGSRRTCNNAYFM